MGIVTRQIMEVLREPAHQAANLELRRVVAKDVMISYLLSFLYNHREYRKLAFYGGTCARVLYGLDRFSEDIDLDNSLGIVTTELKSELESFVQNQMQMTGVQIYTQKGEGGIMRWVVRVPVMHELGLSPNDEEKLHVKIEMSNLAKGATIEKTPILRHGQACVVTHFDEPSLMASKMIACLEREWSKGRDIYDLLFYMNKRTQPNVEVLQKAGKESYSAEKAWGLLSAKIENLAKSDLEDDLRSFITNGEYLSLWLDNFYNYYKRLLASY